MKHLQIGTADDAPFYVPIDIVTEKLAFLGRTGSGKTYSATKLAELMLDAGAQIIALDPVGVWRGLRMGSDFQIYIFGGQSGDFPLESTGGALVADLIVERGISAVLDVSQFGTDTEHRRFATDFANRFFHLKKTKPSAVHVFVEEAQEFIPQDKQHGDEKMLHSFQRLWKLGRNFGIGGSIISQRPQDVNKKALNMSGTLFVHQMTAPGDRDVISRWVDEKGIEADVGAILPKIKVGRPHVWSPDFLKCSEEVAIASKLSADISSTPKVGAASKAQSLTPVDADKISRDMAATIERAKENDPEELKKRVAQLRAELAKKPAPVATPAQRIEVPVLTDASLNVIRAAIGEIGLMRSEIAKFDATAEKLWKEFNAMAGNVARSAAQKPMTQRPAPARPTVARAASPSPRVSLNAQNSELGKCELAVLRVLAQYPDGCEMGKIALLSGYRVSGGFRNSLSALRTVGAIEGDNMAVMRITEAGEAYGPFEPLPQGEDLRQYWLTHRSFGKCERAILQALLNNYPQTMEEIAKSCEPPYEVSGGFRNALSCLRTAGVIVGRNTDQMQPSDELLS